MFEQFLWECFKGFLYIGFQILIVYPVCVGIISLFCGYIVQRFPIMTKMLQSFVVEGFVEHVFKNEEDNSLIDEDKTEIKDNKPISDVENEFFGWDRQNNSQYYDNDTDWNSSTDEFDVDLYGDNVVIDTKQSEQYSEDSVYDEDNQEIDSLDYEYENTEPSGFIFSHLQYSKDAHYGNDFE